MPFQCLWGKTDYSISGVRTTVSSYLETNKAGSLLSYIKINPDGSKLLNIKRLLRYKKMEVNIFYDFEIGKTFLSMTEVQYL